MRHISLHRHAVVAAALTASAMTLAAAPPAQAEPAQTKLHSAFGVNATGTVEFWARSATSPVAELMVKQFNATHKNLHVKLFLTTANEASSQLATALRAGTPPDLVGLNDINVPAFAREGALLNLTKYVNALPYKSQLSPGHFKLAQLGNQYYGVPYLADLSVLWYNTKLFREAHLNGPPTTFQQMLSDAKAITALGHGTYGFTFAGNCQGCLGFTMLPDIWASGQHLITGPLNDEHANIAHNAPLKALLTTYHDIWADRLVPPADRSQSGSTWGDDFAKGNIGMAPEGYALYPTLVKSKLPSSEYADAPLPGENGNYSTFDGGDDFVIPKGAKNPSGAWEFLTWVLQRKQQQEYPSVGFTPVLVNAFTPALLKKYPYDAVALKALAHGSVEYTVAYNQVFNAPGSPWMRMFQEAVYAGNVAGALSAGQSAIQSTLTTAESVG